MEDFNSASQVQGVMSYGDFWNQQNDAGNVPHAFGYMEGGNGQDFLSRIGNWFTGSEDKIRQAYDAYLKQNERAYEQAKINDARRYEEWLASTQYQRAVKDMKAAGLNPYLLVNGNGLNGTAVRSSANSTRGASLEGSYDGNKTKSKELSVAGIVGTALKLLAVLAA